MAPTTRRSKGKYGYGVALALLMLFTSYAATASLGPAPRRAEQAREGRDSFEWPSDVRDRLRILDDHATEAARERPAREHPTIPSRWRPPSPPVAGEERR